MWDHLCGALCSRVWDRLRFFPNRDDILVKLFSLSGPYFSSFLSECIPLSIAFLRISILGSASREADRKQLFFFLTHCWDSRFVTKLWVNHLSCHKLGYKNHLSVVYHLPSQTSLYSACFFFSLTPSQPLSITFSVPLPQANLAWHNACCINLEGQWNSIRNSNVPESQKPVHLVYDGHQWMW